MKNLWFEIEIFVSRIRNVFKWLPTIWKDGDYDYIYILDVLRFKLKKIKHRYETQGCFVGNEEEIRWLTICVNLIESIVEGNSYDKYVNIKNMPEYNKIKEFISKYLLADAYDTKCIQLLFKILAWRMPYWWD